MSEDVKLKLCPFCGSEHLTHRPANETHYDVGYVKCNDCLSSASVKAWSTRTNPAAVKGVIEALEKTIDVVALYGMFIAGIMPMDKLQNEHFKENHKILGLQLQEARAALARLREGEK